MKCALITAGGCGTRLFPLSTKETPKQFVKMFGNKTLLELTYERINKYFDNNNIFIVLPEKYKHFVKELLPFINEENIIVEPEQRSTAPCILYSCLKIKELRDNATLFVFPADHYIQDNSKFINTIDNAYNYVIKNNSFILVGVKPTESLGRYGYLKVSGKKQICTIKKFKEKPNKFKSFCYFLSNKYYWSTDIYGFNIDYMLNLFKKYMPGDFELLTNSLLNIDEAYKLCTPVSTAYGIFEKMNNIYMIKGDFGWDDVGVFESLLKYTNNKNVLEAYNIKNISKQLKSIENIVQDN